LVKYKTRIPIDLKGSLHELTFSSFKKLKYFKLRPKKNIVKSERRKWHQYMFKYRVRQYNRFDENAKKQLKELAKKRNTTPLALLYKEFDKLNIKSLHLRDDFEDEVCFLDPRYVNTRFKIINGHLKFHLPFGETIPFLKFYIPDVYEPREVEIKFYHIYNYTIIDRVISLITETKTQIEIAMRIDWFTRNHVYSILLYTEDGTVKGTWFQSEKPADISIKFKKIGDVYRAYIQNSIYEPCRLKPRFTMIRGDLAGYYIVGMDGFEIRYKL